MAARVRLPILVTRQKFITQDTPDDTTVMDIVEDATITVTNRETGSPQTVYKSESGPDTFAPMEMVSNSRGRFEGWVERSLVAIEVVYGDQSYVEHFDAVPAKDGSVDGDWIEDETITADNLGPGSVTNPKLAEGAVTDTKVHSSNKDGAAGTPSMRTLGEGANQAAAGNDARLTNSRPPSGSAGGDLTGSYPNPTVGSLKITEGKIAGAAVTNAKLGSQAVERDKIKDAAVNAAKLDTDAVETAKIKNANVTRAKLAADTMDQAAGVSSMRKLDPTGADPTAAAPANDSRFTALISSANAIQTNWINDDAVTSAKVNLSSSGSFMTKPSSAVVFDKNSGDGTGIIAFQSTADSVGRNLVSVYANVYAVTTVQVTMYPVLVFFGDPTINPIWNIPGGTWTTISGTYIVSKNTTGFGVFLRVEPGSNGTALYNPVRSYSTAVNIGG